MLTNSGRNILLQLERINDVDSSVQFLGSIIPNLIAFVHEGDKLLQRTSICALGEFATAEAEETLKAASCYQDPESRDAAIEAYKKLRMAGNVVK